MSKFRPMKGDDLVGDPRLPLIAMPKIDGIRCAMKDSQPLSNSLKVLPNLHFQRLANHPALHGIDSELTIGDPAAKDVYRKTNSAVMTIAGEPDLTVRAFDLFDHPGTYQERLAALHQKVATMPDELRRFVEVVPSEYITTMEQLERFEAKWVGEMGYEGVIIRCPDGPYKHGRSTLKQGWLLKLKRFLDDEAVIVGFNEQMSNQNDAQVNELGLTRRSSAKAGLVPAGVLGNVVAQWRGVEFEIGTGFTADDRASLWRNRDNLIGQLVKFKYFPVGMKDAPRHPVFLGFRDPIDMTDY